MQTDHAFWRATTLALAAAGLIVLGASHVPARELDHALSLLEQARAELKAAKNDKGGHRQRAMERVDDAVSVIREEQRYRMDRRDERREQEKADDDRGRPKEQQKKKQMDDGGRQES